MNIVCAQCGAGVTYELPSLANETVVVCSTCQTGLKVTIEAFALPVTAEPPGKVATPSTRQRAVVVVEGEATREMIGELLSVAGFDVIEATSASEAFSRVRDARPAVVLVDVGLSDMPGFQVCETIRGDSTNRGVKIILVAAIHNKDRYRRQPDNLFGADDYIERHQIESHLVEKVNRLIGGETPAGAASGESISAADPVWRSPEPSGVATPAASPPVGIGTVTAGLDARPVQGPTTPTPATTSTPPAPSRVQPAPMPAAPPVAVIRTPDAAPPAKEKEAVAAAPPPPPAVTNPAQEAARRLARIIVSDIALYNAKKVDEGVVSGTFFDLLRAEIEEGRKLYEERKGSSLETSVDLFQQTLEQFVATRRELIKRSRPAA